MNRVDFLEQIKSFTETAVSDLILPVRMQKGDTEQTYRAAEVYKMRLPDSQSATKKCPYIIQQIVTASDAQPTGQRSSSSVVLRSIFGVYYEDEQEGSLALLNLMERWRIAVLEKRVVGNRYYVDLSSEPMQSYIYPDNTAPYFIGETTSTWILPAVEREKPTWPKT